MTIPLPLRLPFRFLVLWSITKKEGSGEGGKREKGQGQRGRQKVTSDRYTEENGQGIDFL